MRASKLQQQLVLELARLDNQSVTVTKQLSSLPEEAEIAALEPVFKKQRAQALNAERELENTRSKLQKVQDDLATCLKRAAHDAKLLAATADAKLAARLNSEIETLQKRQVLLEESELELLAAEEEAQQHLAKLEQQTAQVQAKAAQLAEQKQEKVAQLQREKAQILSQCEAKRVEITGDLLAEYDTVRARAGIGAARLVNGVSEASGMQLSPGELAEVAAMAPDELFYCPLTGVILVRE